MDKMAKNVAKTAARANRADAVELPATGYAALGRALGYANGLRVRGPFRAALRRITGDAAMVWGSHAVITDLHRHVLRNMLARADRTDATATRFVAAVDRAIPRDAANDPKNWTIDAKNSVATFGPRAAKRAAKRTAKRG
jgi:hypothetical protein